MKQSIQAREKFDERDTIARSCRMNYELVSRAHKSDSLRGRVCVVARGLFSSAEPIRKVEVFKKVGGKFLMTPFNSWFVLTFLFLFHN